MADCSSIEARLNKARETYDNWMNGQFISRFIDQNGESVSYSAGGLSQLTGYIAKLENDLAICQGLRSAYRGPLKFTYGPRRF